MKPTKMRNKQIYYATSKTRSNQVSSNLSKELRNKFGKRSVRVVKGDTVKILRGEFNGTSGKITKVVTGKNSVIIEGIKREKVKGDKVDIPIQSSNLIITAINTDDKWRINKLEGNSKKSLKEKKVTEKKVEEKVTEKKVEEKVTEKKVEEK